MKILEYILFLVLLKSISCQNNRNSKPSGRPAKKAGSVAVEIAPDDDSQHGPGSSKDSRGGNQQGVSASKPVEQMKLHLLKSPLATCNDGTAAG